MEIAYLLHHRTYLIGGDEHLLHGYHLVLVLGLTHGTIRTAPKLLADRQLSVR
jgi:hypothetical protein